MKTLITLALGAAGYWLYRSGRLQPQLESLKQTFGSSSGPAQQQAGAAGTSASSPQRQSVEMREWPAQVAAAPSYQPDHPTREVQPTGSLAPDSKAPAETDRPEGLRDWPEPVVAAPSYEPDRADSEAPKEEGSDENLLGGGYAGDRPLEETRPEAG